MKSMEGLIEAEAKKKRKELWAGRWLATTPNALARELRAGLDFSRIGLIFQTWNLMRGGHGYERDKTRNFQIRHDEF